VWQSIFAVVEVVGDPDSDPTRERWRWRFPIRPLVLRGGSVDRQRSLHSVARL
jgi:hypothetical protein